MAVHISTMIMKDKLKVIARIRTDFPQKFGVPRQSGVIEALKGYVVFEPAYRNADAVRGLEGFDYIWLLWAFEGADREGWHATVRPPRLGGNTRMGVFATRSPFRPNPIGLSSVRLEQVLETEEGPVLCVSGVDMRDNTPVYDIKPYLPYTDSHPDARDGFAAQTKGIQLEVAFPEELLAKIPQEKRQALIAVLAQDPRPSYQEDAARKYGVLFDAYDVCFTVSGKMLTVCEVNKTQPDA